MQFKFKTLAAAALLAAASLPSFAVINTTTAPSLVLYAYDANGSGATYWRDLGAGSLNSVLNAAAGSVTTFAAPTASIFTSTFAAAGVLVQWGLAAVDFLDPTKPAYYVATGSAGLLAANTPNVGGGLVGSTSLGTSGAFSLLDGTASYIKPNGEYTGDPTGVDFSNAATYSANTTFNTTAGIGESLNFYKYTNTSVTQLNTAATGSAFQGSAAGGYFTVLADGALTWSAAPAPVGAVPVPAAALLFGPALLAMAGVGRRNKKSV